VTNQEKNLIATILLLVGLVALIDLATDAKSGTYWWHLFTEALIAAISLFGVFWLVKDNFQLKRKIQLEEQLSEDLRQQSKIWKKQAHNYLQGLSHSINQQLNVWQLTNSEKEIAFLLLKGLSLREIGQLRETSEKTVRAQSTSIYAKAGFSGRSQLSAFFLEDLLLPQQDLPDIVPPEESSPN